MEVDTAQQQLYDPVADLTRYVKQRNKPMAREQKEKHTPEGLWTNYWLKIPDLGSLILTKGGVTFGNGWYR
jgi:hypothetical protein